MCQYCNYNMQGWDRLLDYDDVYQRAVNAGSSRSTHGFHESWDELREQVSPADAAADDGDGDDDARNADPSARTPGSGRR
ncbi:hypothetical protein [Halegenticoccus soli]|uniref:hypothetical protein n=1 Tax=Halegenticoccus soli TaxID=1985678 RepID=UPI000C6D865B|nr:hypothetical protein [Halegenticoccus soli]